jgi:ubiquitin-conjugating enzyme E2 D/E
LEGPPKTPYENGFFIFEMIFYDDFPFKPPKFIFKTKIFHPNIDNNGLVSVDILQENYSPAILSFDKTIISVQSLLDDPNPDDFLNEEAAKLLKENKKKYEITVKNYTSQYANYLIFKNELQNLNIKIKTIDKK